MSLKDLDHKERSDQSQELAGQTPYSLSSDKSTTKTAFISVLLKQGKDVLLFHCSILNNQAQLELRYLFSAFWFRYY